MAEQNATRTIEDIERRQREVRMVEIEAMDVLVRVLRDIAVNLPVESKLTYDLADCAKALENDIAWLLKPTEPGKPAVCASNELRTMTRQIREEIERWKPEEQ